jgi:hypothetical protein
MCNKSLLYPWAYACMLAIGLLACVIHQHNKNSSTTMAGLKRGEPHPSVKWSQSPIHQPFIDHDSWSIIKVPWGSKLMSSKKFISSLRVPGSMPGPKPLKETQFCQLANEFPIARVPRDVYNLVELKHPQMHHCFRTSCHLYWNYFIFGNQFIVNGPCYLCSTNVFSRDDMNTQHEERSNYQYLCKRR